MKNIYANVLLTLFVFSFATANAQTISQLSFYSPLINTFDMKYSNNHLVVSQNGLLIFDVTDPAKKPKLVAQTSYPGSIAYSVAVQDNYAYMGFGNNGIFAVYDISNFNAPLLKGSLPVPALSYYGPGDIAIKGSYAYLSGFDSLYIVNISNPSSPAIVNVVPVAHTDFTGAEDIAIEGNSLFVKTPFTIEAYDITHPTAPSLLSPITYLHTYNNRLAADSIHHRLFLSWATALKEFAGHDTYDVSHPSSPTYLFSDSTEFSPGDFGIMDYSYSDNVLFVSGGGSINAFDVSASHHFVTSFSGQDIPNASVSIQVRDSVFFHARGGGIEVLQYGSEAAPGCDAPQDLRTKVNGTTAYFVWNKTEDAKGYLFRYRKVNRAWQYDSSLDNVNRIANLAPNTLYYWEVATVCNAKTRTLPGFSSTERFNTGNAIAGITLYPNPAVQSFTIRLDNAAAKKVVIKNSFGSTAMQLPFQNGRAIAVADMMAGMYTVIILDENNNTIAKAMLIKK